MRPDEPLSVVVVVDWTNHLGLGADGNIQYMANGRLPSARSAVLLQNATVESVITR